MIFFEEDFEEGMDDYLEDTATFPHSRKKGKNTPPLPPASHNGVRSEQSDRLRCVYRALGLTARGKLPKSAAQKRVEKFIGRERS